MNRLQANQQLNADDELMSNNGWFGFHMYNDGSFGLYRTQTRTSLWSAPRNASGQPGSFIVMQGDGNFVAYAPDGTPYWATNTDGNPGASVVLQDDGNLVVYDAADRPLWASNTVQDLRSPTIRYWDRMGYSYNETSESWKELCSAFPCFFALQWPGYASDIVEDIINEQPVVIQLWKGFCPKFFGLQFFPGGVGAEVGVYRRIPGRARPASLPFPLNMSPLNTKVLGALATLADNELWWPFPELGAEIEYTLTNPNTNQPFFSAGPEKSYSMAKWMDPDSYDKYREDQGRNTPTQLENYILDYKINGNNYPRWSTGRAMARKAVSTTVSQPWLELLLLNRS
jgi:hypothetical protein